MKAKKLLKKFADEESSSSDESDKKSKVTKTVVPSFVKSTIANTKTPSATSKIEKSYEEEKQFKKQKFEESKVPKHHDSKIENNELPISRKAQDDSVKSFNRLFEENNNTSKHESSSSNSGIDMQFDGEMTHKEVETVIGDPDTLCIFQDNNTDVSESYEESPTEMGSELSIIEKIEYSGFYSQKGSEITTGDDLIKREERLYQETIIYDV